MNDGGFGKLSFAIWKWFYCSFDWVKKDKNIGYYKIMVKYC